MTEERRKELAEDQSGLFVLPDRMAADATGDETYEFYTNLRIAYEQLIRTVAAESRKEGIEAARLQYLEGRLKEQG